MPFHQFFASEAVANGAAILDVLLDPVDMQPVMRPYSTDDATLDSTVRVDMEGGGAVPQVGTRYTLINGTVANYSETTAFGMKGFSLLYEYDMDASNGLVATVRRISANPDASVLPRGRAASTTLLNAAVTSSPDREWRRPLPPPRPVVGVPPFRRCRRRPQPSQNRFSCRC